jgi:RsiW-degrading membrane proteinase PrsW (M82 family)/L-amino acid N-acyltransferase YncA
MAQKPPHKWLGRKGSLLIVALGTVLWFGTVLFEVIVFHVNEAPTNSLLIGGFTVASAFIYTMAYRLRPSDRLSVSRLLVAFMVGGILSTTLASPLNGLDNLWSGGTLGNGSLVTLSLAGVVEELVKILIVLVVSIGLPRKNVRNGLFLGGAVGFGFAAIEDVSYARAAWNNAFHDHVPALPPEIYTVISRDVIGIFGHPLFTALFAAAVFAAVRNGRFRLTWRVVVAYLGVAFAHGLFDVSGEFAYRVTRSYGLAQLTFWFVAVAEAIVLSLIWRHLSGRANRQARQLVRHANPDDLPFLVTMLVEAANWDGTRATTPASVKEDASSWRYLEGWQRATDFGVVALDGDQPVGAAWARFLTKTDAGYGYVSDSVPELTVAVAMHARHQGFGEQLLDGLIESARDLELEGVSLSVEDGNTRARALYKNAGFETVGRNGNSDTMLLRLQP